jgi:hypothetical protein
MRDARYVQRGAPDEDHYIYTCVLYRLLPAAESSSSSPFASATFNVM